MIQATGLVNLEVEAETALAKLAGVWRDEGIKIGVGIGVIK